MTAPPDEASEETGWVEAARRGDRQAFERLYARYAPMVHGILLARVPRIDVEDLVQEVFLLVFRRVKALRRAEAFPAWLASIARNRATDHGRRLPKTEPLSEESGAPLVGSTPISRAVRLSVGQRIETDALSRAKLGIPRVAEISIAPNSRVRLVRSRLTEQRLALERGRISANISAPPRIFFVETPSALAVDLGCSYTLEVDEAGSGLLRVETGWVAFRRGGRESIVPAGAACATRPVTGPGTPYCEDSMPAFRRALGAVDSGSREPGDLSTLLSEARRRDGLTLWHLLANGREKDRELVRVRLAQLVPPPAGVTQEGVLRGDRKMLELWRGELDGVPRLPSGGSLQSLWWKFRFSLTGA